MWAASPGEQQPSVAHRLVDVTPHRCHGLGGDRSAFQGPVGVGRGGVPPARAKPRAGGGRRVRPRPARRAIRRGRCRSGPAGRAGTPACAPGAKRLPRKGGGGRRVGACCAGRSRARHARRSTPRRTVGLRPGHRARSTGTRARTPGGSRPGRHGGRCRGSRRSRPPIRRTAPPGSRRGRSAPPAARRARPRRRSPPPGTTGWPVGELEGDEVLHDLRAGVDRDRTAAGEDREVEVVPLAVEAQLDAVVHHALDLQAFGGAARAQRVDRALLQRSGTPRPPAGDTPGAVPRTRGSGSPGPRSRCPPGAAAGRGGARRGRRR